MNHTAALSVAVALSALLFSPVALAQNDAVDEAARPVPEPDYVLPGQADDDDPEVITRDEVTQLDQRTVDGLLPLLDREPFQTGKQTLDNIDKNLINNYAIYFTPSFTQFYQTGTNGGSDNSSVLSNLDIPALWTPFDSDEWYGRGTLGTLYRFRDEWHGTTPRELSDNIGINAQINDSGVAPDVALNTLLQLWWEQAMFDNQLVVRLGRVDQGSYLDTSLYAGSDKLLFMAQPIADGSPNRRFPQEGFGYNVIYRPKQAPVQFGFGMHDANANNRTTGFNTVFDGDFFFGGMAAFTPDVDGVGKGFYRFTGTFTQDNPTNGEQWSWMLSFDQEIAPLGIGAFLRYGMSDGQRRRLGQQGGTGVVFLSPFGFADDKAGVGLAWQSEDSGGENDFAIETFYRFALSKRVQLTPDIQVWFPHEEDKDVAAIFTLRLRTFF
ncbi:MAG: carbohydrate porin [Planctomycetota bacterium]